MTVMQCMVYQLPRYVKDDSLDESCEYKAMHSRNQMQMVAQPVKRLTHHHLSCALAIEDSSVLVCTPVDKTRWTGRYWFISCGYLGCVVLQ